MVTCDQQERVYLLQQRTKQTTSKPTQQLATYLRYAASAFPPAQDRPKPRRTRYRTCWFLTFAVANLVSLSDLGFLCRCSISLSESNSPLHIKPINVTTQNFIWQGKQAALFTLGLSPILGHCLTIHSDTNASCSLRAVPCVGYPLQKSTAYFSSPTFFNQFKKLEL